MKNFLASVCFCLLSTSVFPLMAVAQQNYGGVGIGYSEACRTKYEPGFSGGDCIEPNVDVRGLMGKQISDYFAVESSLDVSFDSGHILDAALDALLSDDSEGAIYSDPNQTETNRWSITTLAVHAFAELPLGNSLRLFAGPSLGASMVDIDYDVTYFGESNSNSNSTVQFGLNYGWAAGLDILQARDSFVRLQWQNWRSLDANRTKNNEFNSNTFTVNFVGYF